MALDIKKLTKALEEAFGVPDLKGDGKKDMEKTCEAIADAVEAYVKGGDVSDGKIT